MFCLNIFVSLLYWGKCVEEYVGVNVFGNEKIIMVFLLKMLLVVWLIYCLLLWIVKVMLGIFWFLCEGIFIGCVIVFFLIDVISIDFLLEYGSEVILLW